MQSLGQKPSDSEVEAMIQQADQDGNTFLAPHLSLCFPVDPFLPACANKLPLTIGRFFSKFPPQI